MEEHDVERIAASAIPRGQPEAGKRCFRQCDTCNEAMLSLVKGAAIAAMSGINGEERNRWIRIKFEGCRRGALPKSKSIVRSQGRRGSPQHSLELMQDDTHLAVYT